MNVNLRQIQALVSIARLGSFTKAADLLHLSQSALTVQIHHLEETLGVRLLDRNTRSVKLTRSGIEVMPALEGVLRAIDGVIANTRSVSARTRGIVRIAALPSVCSGMLPAIIARFRARSPAITIHVRDATAQKVIELVNAEDVDLGIGSVGEPDPRIDHTPLVADRLKVVFPTGHPLEKIGAIKLQDLVGFPMIAFDSESSVRGMVDRAFRSIGHACAPVYEVTYPSSAVGMVKAGLGIAIVSASSLRAITSTGIKSRTIRQPGLTREISVIRRSAQLLSPAADSFLKFLLDRDLRSGSRMREVMRAISQPKP